LFSSSPSRISIPLFTPAGPHTALHSFPTRRSSDLSFKGIMSEFKYGMEEGNADEFTYTFKLTEYKPHKAKKVKTSKKKKKKVARSEEHTSELQSRFDLVCRLLLEKKKKKKKVDRKVLIHKIIINTKAESTPILVTI